MKKWKQRGFAFVLALSLTTGLLTGAQAAVSKETLNDAVQDTAEYMYRTVQNPQVGSIGGGRGGVGGPPAQDATNANIKIIFPLNMPRAKRRAF